MNWFVFLFMFIQTFVDYGPPILGSRLHHVITMLTLRQTVRIPLVTQLVCDRKHS